MFDSYWFTRGKEKQAKFMVVVCDTYDYEDYPCFFNTKEEVLAKIQNPGSMQKIMEICNIDTEESMSVFDFY